jgi:hypothetical protein
LPGWRVRLAGLKGAAHLNGLRGTVCWQRGYDDEKGRYAVVVDGDGDAIKMLKGTNLRLANELPRFPTGLVHLSRNGFSTCPIKPQTVGLGLGHIVTLYYRSSILYKIR